MKNIAIVMFLLLIGCTNPETVPKVKYQKLVHSMDSLQCRTNLMESSILDMRDSLVEFKQRPLMTAEQFIEIYKYESLFDYYKRCVKSPSQWVNYRGWSTRVFEQK